jgi:HSP90 family molecular chaperone
LDKGKLTSLADYVKRMPSDQKEIYCLLAPNRAAAESSPYFEVFQERKFEVLFLYDPWDEFVMEHLRDTFEGKHVKLAEKADLNLNETEKDGSACGGRGEGSRDVAQRRFSATGGRSPFRNASWKARRWCGQRTSS